VAEASSTALLVDDDPRVRRVVSTFLLSLGFQVAQASDARQAIAALDARRPSLLCVDLVLPESSGYDVCEHVRKSRPLMGLPIIMISARNLPADQAMAEELGVGAYLIKPFSKAEFVAQVTRLMESAAPGWRPGPGAPA
jgi:two-component system chemotaxis response regulator CheY